MNMDFSMRGVMTSPSSALVVLIDRRVGLTYPPALPKWEGSLLPDGFVDFPRQNWFEVKSFSPVGDVVPERSEM